MWDVIGHEAIVAALQRAVASGHPAHAWLFAGQEGVGKHTLALQSERSGGVALGQRLAV